MTEINYENGVVVVSQYGVSTIRFRPCDLDYNSRMAMWKAGKELVTSKEAGEVGYLRTQPVEARQVSKMAPETMETGDRCGRCGYVFEFGDRVHEATVAGEYMLLCPACYRNIARRG